MKASKKKSDKLTLRKETIANLMNYEMRGVKGGTNFSDPCVTGEVCSFPLKCKPE